MSLLRRVIGGVLRRLRVRQGRTLREVADAAGVSVPYLSEVERGRKEASSEVLEAICRALGIRLSDLLEEARDDLRRLEPRTPLAPPRVPTGRYSGRCAVARSTRGAAAGWARGAVTGTARGTTAGAMTGTARCTATTVALRSRVPDGSVRARHRSRVLSVRCR